MRDRQYEIFYSDTGQKCIEFGSVVSHNLFVMSFDEWLYLSDKYDLSLSDEDIVNKVIDAHNSSFVSMENFFSCDWIRN